MTKKILLLVLTLIGFQAIGQNILILSGQVIDKETKEQLPWATILYQKKWLGTTSNSEGKFTLNLVDANATDSITISYIGYESIKTVVSSCLKNEKFELNPKSVHLNEVVIKAIKFDLRGFIKKVITDYNTNRKDDPHIAIAHYREKARANGKYIMFMESIGYSVFSGNKENATPLSNYKFFCENTKCQVIHPNWLKYKENLSGYQIENVPPASGSNLNVFRCIELGGILSLKYYKSYSYKIDSTYYINDNPVYRIRFNGKGDNGTINVYADSRQILKLDCTTNELWSTAFHQRVAGRVKIQFNYFDKTPFLFSVESYSNHEGLEHFNLLTVLLQKLNKFEMNWDEYWAMDTYGNNPFIIFSPSEWQKYRIPYDADYNTIESDLKINGIELNEQFVNYSGRWFSKQNSSSGDQARIKIKELKNNF